MRAPPILASLFAAIALPAAAQTVSQPVGCIAGIDCSAKSLTLANGMKITDTSSTFRVTDGGGSNSFILTMLGSSLFQMTGNLQITGGVQFGTGGSNNGGISAPSNGTVLFNNNNSTANFTLSTLASNTAGFQGPVKALTTTVSGLPSCTPGLDGAEAFVTDANSTTFMGALAGSGTNHVPVHCDGSGSPTWKIG